MGRWIVLFHVFCKKSIAKVVSVGLCAFLVHSTATDVPLK
jgi:hypothetical protein